MRNAEQYSKTFGEFYDQVENKLMVKDTLTFSELKDRLNSVLQHNNIQNINMQEYFNELMVEGLSDLHGKGDRFDLDVRGCYRYDQYAKMLDMLVQNSDGCAIYGRENLSLTKSANANDTTLADVIDLSVNSPAEKVQNQAA